MPGEARVDLDEAGDFLGHFLDEVVLLQLLEVRPVVLADAEELVEVGNRREVADLALCVERGCESCIGLRGVHERPRRFQPGLAALQETPHRRRHVGVRDLRRAREVEDALAEPHADARLDGARKGKGEEPQERLS
jgi:hypothetical protein